MLARTDPPMLTPFLHEVRRVAGVDAAFGGLAESSAEHFVIDQLVGVTSNGLRNLHVDIGTGLGGKAVALGQPVHVRDYCAARGITHQYDLAVREEQLHAMFAVPIRIPRGPRGAVYGALRHPELIGDRVIDRILRSVRAFEHDAAVQIEVARRLAELQHDAERGSVDRAHHPASADARIADICAELVHIQSSMVESVDRQMIRALIQRISNPETSGSPTKLAEAITSRERDVLVQVACGYTNKQVGDRLGVGVETVKSSLKSSMRKLGAHNRMDVVTRARAGQVIP